MIKYTPHKELWTQGMSGLIHYSKCVIISYILSTYSTNWSQAIH